MCIRDRFYDVPRQFRLLGRDGGAFVAYGNGGLRPRALLTGGYRVPEFDLEVMAQDETPYQTMEYNQLALQLFQMGFFRSDMAEQALRCLELMDFKNKDRLMSSILRGQTADPARQAQSVPAGVAEMQKLSAMDRMRQQTQEAVRPR